MRAVPLGKGTRGFIFQGTVGPLLVVIDPPLFGFSSRIGKIVEKVLIQALLPKPPVERFPENILYRSSLGKEMYSLRRIDLEACDLDSTEGQV